MKTRNKWTALILLGALVLSLLTSCAGTPANDGTPVTTPEGSQGGTQQNTPDAVPSTPEGSAEAPAGDTLSANENGKILVVYYSATGSTEAVAGYIAGALNTDIFSITPTEPYTSDDLNWRDRSSRSSREHDDPSLRVMELTETTVDGWENYDTVFIGYPIWWGIAAWPVDNFISANDFTGKTVIPFCTSSSSGLGESGDLLAELAGTGNWLKGQRFRSSVAEADVVEWVNGLNLQ